MPTPDISVVFTTFNEQREIDDLLQSIKIQDLDGLAVEVLMLDAGGYDESRARSKLGEFANNLVFFSDPGLSRTKALNKLFEEASADIIVRLDARSRIEPDYLQRIYLLFRESGAAAVGGVMMPTAENGTQRIIAEVMKCSFSFGGAKARNRSFRGAADSVYLGAYHRRRCNSIDEWFDARQPRISEDSDLNFRIRKSGGVIFIDGGIEVAYEPRDTLGKFFKLSYNYGVGRGIFVIKHRMLTAFRQWVPLVALLLGAILAIYGFANPAAWLVLGSLILSYLGLCVVMSFRMASKLGDLFTAVMAFSLCHAGWVVGFLLAPFVYIRAEKERH